MNVAVEAGNTEVRFYITYKGEGTLTANLYKDGVKVDAEKVGMTKVGDKYLVRITNVPVTHYDTVYTVEVTDGNNTFVANKTVREYLAVLLADCNTGEDGTAADMVTGNVLRTMYQLYQVVAGNTGADTCTHGTRGQLYWVPSEDGAQDVRCSLCHAYVAHQSIDANVAEYIPAALFQKVSKTGSIDVTLMKEDGKEFVRLDNFWANRDNWGDVGLAGVLSSNTVTGQYMIIKYRIGAEGNAATYIEAYVNTNLSDKKNLQAAGGTKILNTSTDGWVTAIIDLSTRVSDPSVAFKPAADGSYDVQYLSFRVFPYAAVAVTDDSAAGRYVYTYKYTLEGSTKYETFNGTKLTEEELAAKVAEHPDYALAKIGKMNISENAYVDVAYVAFSDDVAEVKSLIDTDIYVDSVANDKNMYYNTEDGTCAHFARDSKEYIDGNTYSYNKCAQCGEYEHSKTLADSVKLYFSPYKISVTGTSDPKSPRVHYNFGSKGFVSESDVAYFGFTGKDAAAQFIWNRTGYSADQAYTMDVGNAKYLVLKMRLSNTNLSANFGISFSTTAADSSTYNALPVKSSTAGQWATYVIDLASVYGSQYGLDSESNTYKVDTFYFHTDKLMKTDKVDIAGFAFVEGDWSEVAKLIDTDTAIVQTVKSGAGVVVDSKTGKCVGGVHAEYSVKAVDGVYKYTCDACGDVAIDYQVSADATSAYWPAELLYRKATKTGQSPDWTSWTGKVNNIDILTEDGMNFLRLKDAETNHADNGAWGGWFLQQSTENATAGRYMVIKVRRSSNVSGLTGLNFWIPSHGGYVDWAGGAVTVALGQDATWHTIVVDLAGRNTDGKFVADANGNYGPRTVHMRPFGSGKAYDNTTDEYIDIAYMAFFKDLDDIPEIVKDETYEFSKTNTSSVTLITATGACKACSPAYVADDTDARGYRYECSACGKDFAIDYYTSGKGGCFVYNAGQYAGTATLKTDEAGFQYMSFLSTGTTGTFFNYNTNNSGGGGVSDQAVKAGRFLVVKLKGDTAADVKFHVGTDDFPKSNSNYVGGSLGVLTPTTMPTEWQVAVIDLTGLANYSLGESHKIFISSTTGGGEVVTTGAQVDIAYMMLVSDLNDIKAITGDEPIMYYGNSFNATPKELDFDCAKSGHLYGYELATGDDGSKTYTYTCGVCGDTKVQTVSADVNWFAPLSSMGKYQGTLQTNLLDTTNGVLYNRYISTGGNHLNITGGGGAGSLTSATFKTGKYIVIKYRTEGEGMSLSFNVATGDKKSGNGSSVGKNQTGATLPGMEWRVAVLDASENSQWTSDGSAQKFYIMMNPNAAGIVDIAYVAVVDTIEEARSLLVDGETYYDLGKVWGNTTPKHLNQDGSCVAHSGAESVSGSTYTYTCTACGEVLKTITLDESVKKYYSANELNTTAKVYFGGSHAYAYDPVNNAAYMNTNAVQIIWQRMDHDMTYAQTNSTSEEFSVNVGNAKYIVIKARSNDATANLRFCISTTAKNAEVRTVTEADFKDGVLNSTIATYKKILADGTTDAAYLCAAVGDQYYVGEPKTSVHLMGKGQASGEWVTYVVDLETVCDGYYEKVDGQDYYDVDCFYFHNAGTNDIAYVAFVEGSWAEIDALVDEDVVMQITANGSGNAAVGKLVNVADGSDAQ